MTHFLLTTIVFLIVIGIMRGPVFGRKPDFIIGKHEDPYLLRWWIIPRNRFFNLYCHNIRRDDDGRALHDHPWGSISFPLTKGLWEVYDSNKHGCEITRPLRQFRLYFRKSKTAHRLEVFSPRGSEKRPAKAWTLFFTGPVIRNWGFHCPKGWVSWQDFTAPEDKGQIGAGCGEYE